MTGDLRRIVGAAWFVAKHDAAYRKLRHDAAFAKIGRFGIMIAADPDPIFGQRPECGERVAIRLPHALSGLYIMEAVAKANDALWPIGLDDEFQTGKRVVAIKRWNEPSPRGSSRSLFKMKIRDDESVMRRNIYRA